MSYSLDDSNPLIDLCTGFINVLRPRHNLVYNHSRVLHVSDLLIAVEFTFRQTSLTSLTFCELHVPPKISKLLLQIFRIRRLLENQLEIVAKSNQAFSLGETDQSMRQ